MTEENKDAWDFENVDPIYKKGFEHGYWLRRGNSPDLDGVIEGSKNHQGYSSGLKAGKREAERELFLEQLNQADKERDNDKGFEIE